MVTTGCRKCSHQQLPSKMTYTCRDWPTDHNTDCCSAVIGSPRYPTPTILCSTPKMDPVGPPSLLAAMVVAEYLFISVASTVSRRQYISVVWELWALLTEIGRTTNSDRVFCFFHYTHSTSFIRSSWSAMTRSVLNQPQNFSLRCRSRCCFSGEQDDLTVISPSTNKTYFHMICLPKFDMDPTRTEIWTLHTFP